MKPSLNGLRSLSAHDLLNRDFQPRQTLLEPWLRTEETCVIWAASGVGKTMLSLSIALAIAGGGKVGDWNAPSPRRVLYIDGEMHIQDIKERLVMLAERKAKMLTKAQREKALLNLRLLARQDQDLDAPFYDLTEEETHDAIIRRVQREKAELVILDNFTTLTDGLEDENAATAFKKVQKFFLQLKRLGVATILVHHANKGGRDMRGSTALETTFEVILGLKRPTISKPGEARFETEFTKFRGKGDHRLEAREWTLGEDGWRVEERHPEDPKDDPVYVALKSLRYTSRAAIAKELGIDKSTAKRRIDRLIKLGALSKDEVETCFAKAKELEWLEDDSAFGPKPWDDDNPDLEDSELAVEEF